jgi:hypothetical protein
LSKALLITINAATVFSFQTSGTATNCSINTN